MIRSSINFNRILNDLKLPMALIPVKGGLGNQMFFYAFGLYLKENNIKSLLVWHEYIFTVHHNGVELFDAFDIPLNKYRKFHISFFVAINNSILPSKFKKVLGRIYMRGYAIFSRSYYQSSPNNFDDVISIFKKRKSLYLNGFWQNYQYLSPVSDKILKEFRFRLPVNFDQNTYFKKIIATNSVSIHIRRADYLDPAFHHLNVIKSTDYYLRAIEYIKEKCENLVFFFFTDDMLWAKNNFVAENYIFVEGNINELSYLDMYLTSICKHNIIANSTFSWWGGWLNINPLKIVVAPEQWTLHTSSSEFCPPNWVFLSV